MSLCKAHEGLSICPTAAGLGCLIGLLCWTDCNGVPAKGTLLGSIFFPSCVSAALNWASGAAAAPALPACSAARSTIGSFISERLRGLCGK